MTLEYLLLSHSGRATCKYRREDTVRRRSQRCTVFGSFGDSRKPDEEQWWSPGNAARSEHWCSECQDERQDLCLEDGTSKSICIGNCRILFLGEMSLQERELCTLQGVMDANSFNILWTEASWVRKRLTPHYLNQENHL